MLDETAERFGVPLGIARRMMGQESGGNKDAESYKGARGLMQVMPGTARGLGYDPDNMTPEQNIEAGMKYLRQNFDRFGRWDHAVAAYHAGPGAVSKAGGIPNTTDGLSTTRDYTRNIVGQDANAPAGEMLNAAPASSPSRVQQLDQRMIDIATAAEKADKTGFWNNFKNQGKAAGYQIPELAYGMGAFMAATIEPMVGEGGLTTAAKRWSVEGMKDWAAKAQAMGGENNEFNVAYDKAKAGDEGALVDWLGGAFGYSAVQALQMIGTGGAGAVVGKAALRTAAERFAKSEVEKTAAKMAAGKAITEEIRRDAVGRVAGELGLTASIGATALGMEGGEIGGDLVSKNVDRVLTGDELARAWGATGLATAMEFAGDKLGLAALQGKLGKPLEGMTGLKGRAARGLLSGGIAMPGEFGTEFGQTMAEEWGKGGDPFSAETQRQALNAGAMGAVGGGAVGALGGALPGAAAPPAVAPPPAGPSTSDTARAIGAAPDEDSAAMAAAASVDASTDALRAAVDAHLGVKAQAAAAQAQQDQAAKANEEAASAVQTDVDLETLNKGVLPASSVGADLEQASAAPVESQVTANTGAAAAPAGLLAGGVSRAPSANQLDQLAGQESIAAGQPQGRAPLPTVPTAPVFWDTMPIDNGTEAAQHLAMAREYAAENGIDPSLLYVAPHPDEPGKLALAIHQRTEIPTGRPPPEPAHPFDQTMAKAQTEAGHQHLAKEARVEPDQKIVDRRPLTMAQAKARLAVLRDQAEGDDAPRYVAIRNPGYDGKFAIAMLPSLKAAQEQAATAEMAGTRQADTPEDRQARLEAAAQAAKQARERRAPDHRQELVRIAMRNIEERNGVAAPWEAQVLADENLGKPYDRIDPKLGAHAPTTDQLLTSATGIALDANAPAGASPGRAPAARQRAGDQNGSWKTEPWEERDPWNRFIGGDPATAPGDTTTGAYMRMKLEKFRAIGAKTKEGPAPKEPKEPTDNPFMRLLASFGVAKSLQSELMGETGRKGNRSWGRLGMIFKDDGLELDAIAERLLQDGYLSPMDMDDPSDNGGTRKVADMIIDAMNGTRIPSIAEMEQGIGRADTQRQGEYDDTLPPDIHYEDSPPIDIPELAGYPHEAPPGIDNGLSASRQRAAAAGTLDLFAEANLPKPFPDTPAAQVRQTVESVLEIAPAPDGIYHVRTTLVAERHRDLPVAKVTTLQEAATALSHLGGAATERLDALVTDAAGKPLAIVGSFKGDPGSAPVYVSTLLGEAFKIKGAAGIWFSHNHPSGKAEFSDADIRLWKALRDAFNSTGIQPMGFLAQTSLLPRAAGAWVGKAGGNDETGNVTAAQAKGAGGVRIPVVERHFVEDERNANTPEITNGTTAMVAANQMRKEVTAKFGDVPFLMALDVHYLVVGALPVEQTQMSVLRGTGGAAKLFAAISESAMRAFIIVQPKSLAARLSTDTMANIIAAAGAMDASVLDVLTPGTAGLESAAAKSRMPSRRSIFQSVGRASVEQLAGEQGVKDATYEAVDAKTLPRSSKDQRAVTRAVAKVIQQVARVFGKRVEFFRTNIKVDGFVDKVNDPDTIYLNVDSGINPMAVFGHELLHQLQRDHPAAYKALAAVVRQQAGDKGAAAHLKDYGQDLGADQNLEELTADLMGNRFMDDKFWSGVFNELGATPEARGIIIKLAQAIQAAVQKVIRALAKQPGFAADSMVDDLEAVKEAVRVAVRDYAALRHDAAMMLAAKLSEVDAAAHSAATSPHNRKDEPTGAMKDAGNYEKGHVTVGGVDIAIENPAGSKRGPDWPALKSHYGYIKGTVGADGDHVDAFVRQGLAKDYDGPVFVVDQKVNGRFDEHKVMIGWATAEEARAAYHANYTADWNGFRAMTQTDMAGLKDWIAKGNTKLAFALSAQARKTATRAARAQMDGRLVASLARKPAPLARMDKDQRKAFDQWLARRPDAQRVMDDIARLADTPWAEKAVQGALVQEAIHRLVRGEEPGFASYIDKTPVLRGEIKGNPENIWRRLDKSSFIGDASKPINSVDSSFVDCSPSLDCATYCYAIKGTLATPNPIVKSELVNWAVTTDPARAAKVTGDEYSTMPEFFAGKALRLFSKGDLSAPWVPYIKALNAYTDRAGHAAPIRVQVFSKRPDLLRLVPPENVRMLSADKSNVDVVRANPDLPVAFVYTSADQVAFLNEIKDRVQVILPVKIGSKVLTQTQIDALPAWSKPVQCPVDVGVKKIGPNIKAPLASDPHNLKTESGLWNCTSCDKGAGIGCFNGQTTAKMLKAMSQPASQHAESDIDTMIQEMRDAAGQLPAGQREQLLAAMGRLVSAVRAGVDISTEGTGREGDARSRGADDGWQPVAFVRKGGLKASAARQLNAAPIFYSELAKRVEGLTAKTMPAKAWIDAIRGMTTKGVKAEEIEWSAVNDWLAVQEGKVTRDQVVQFLKEGVTVTETRYGGVQKRGAQRPENFVTEQYAAWTRANGLPFESMDEMDRSNMTPEQQTRLSRFEDEWDDAVQSDSEAAYHEEWFLKNDWEVNFDMDGELANIYNGQLGMMVFEDNGVVRMNHVEDERGTADRDPDPEIEAHYMALLHATQDSDNADDLREGRYANYRAVPNGTNYRELVLTLGDREPSFMLDEYIGQLSDKYGRKEVDPATFQPAWEEHDLTAEELARLQLLRKAEDKERAKLEQGDYHSSHWDQKNIVAHVRVDDQQTADGEPVLQVQEIQSDWAQQGKKIGFQEPDHQIKANELRKAYRASLRQMEPMESRMAELKLQRDMADSNRYYHEMKMQQAGSDTAERDKHHAEFVVYDAQYQELLAESDALERAYRPLVAHSNQLQMDLEKYQGSRAKVVGGPFVQRTDSWVALAIKRIIRMAVDGDYKFVALPTGIQSAEVYHLAQYVKQIVYRLAPDGTGMLTAINRDGGHALRESVEKDRLGEYIGEDVAKQLLATEPTEIGGGRLAYDMLTDNIPIGGEGMIEFYDKIVPKVARDVLRRLGGGNVQQLEVVGGPNDLATRVSEHNGQWVILHNRDQTFWNGRSWVRSSGAALHYENKAVADEEVQSKALQASLRSTKPSTQLGFAITPELAARANQGLPLFSRERQSSIDQGDMFMDGEPEPGDNAAAPTAPLVGDVYADPEKTLVLMACGGKKLTTPGLHRLIDLYQGPAWQTLRTHRGAVPEKNIVVVSAKHGIRGAEAQVTTYDERMTPEKADQLRMKGLHWAKPGDEPNGGWSNVLVVGGEDYRPVMDAIVTSLRNNHMLAGQAKVMTVSGGIGEQRGQLGEWLREVNTPAAPAQTAPATPYEPTGNPANRHGEAPVNPDIVVPDIPQAEFAKIVDDWADLFADPDPGGRVIVENKIKGMPFLSIGEAKKRVDGWKAHAKAQARTGGSQGNGGKTVLSLFDYTGQWAEPWWEAGYNVLQFDLQHGQDVNEFSAEYFVENYDISDVYAILAAPPCTDFASSGNRWLKEKQERGDIDRSVELVKQTLRTIEFFRPAIWALENPVGTIERLSGLPKSRLTWNPNHFGDPYTKKTLIWGRFNADLPVAPVEPTEGSKMHRLYGGKSQRTKNARSETPEGFAYAFFMANNYDDMPVAERLSREFPDAAGAVAQAAKAGMGDEEIRGILNDANYDHGSSDNQPARDALAKAVAGRRNRSAPAPAPAAAPAPEPVKTKPKPFKGQQTLFSPERQAEFDQVVQSDLFARGEQPARPVVVKAVQLEPRKAVDGFELIGVKYKVQMDPRADAATLAAGLVGQLRKAAKLDKYEKYDIEHALSDWMVKSPGLGRSIRQYIANSLELQRDRDFNRVAGGISRTEMRDLNTMFRTAEGLGAYLSVMEEEGTNAEAAAALDKVMARPEFLAPEVDPQGNPVKLKPVGQGEQGALFSRGRQTESPEFKRWFGDSKVVDADGQPLVVYHGTLSDVGAFRPGRLYFTADPEYANGYAAYSDANPEMYKGANVMPSYLSIQNPLDLTRFGDAAVEAGAFRDAMAKAGVSTDGVPGGRPLPVWAWVQNRSLNAAIIEAGYDGLIQVESNGVGTTKAYVAFRPGQVKSATGNSGAFDATNPSVTASWSRESVASKIAEFDLHNDWSNGMKNRLADAVGPGTGFNVLHRTIATQYHKASINKWFKRVFDLGQRYLDDITLFATRAEDKAQTIFPRFNGLKSTFKLGVSKADNALVGRALAEGTLENGPDPHSGVVFTDAQLAQRFGMGAKQIGLYREARAMIDQSLDDLAKSEMAAHMRVRRLDEAEVGKLVRADLSLAQVRAGLEQLIQLAEQADPNADFSELRTHLDGIASTTGNLKAAGYAPLMRFGRFTTTGYDATGKATYFRMFDTLSEANLDKRQLEKTSPGQFARIDTGSMNPDIHLLFNGLTPDTLELFAKNAAQPMDQLMQEYLELAISSRSAMKRMIHREGTAGFSLDATRTLAAFTTSNGRRASTNLTAAAMKKAAQDIPKEQGQVGQEATQLVDYLLNPPNEAAQLRGFMFAQYLGGSLAAGLVNMTQPVMMTLPYLSQFGGLGRAGGAMTKALGMVGAATRGNTGNAALDAALARAKADGVTDPQEIYQLMSAADRGAGSFIGHKLQRIWGLNFALTETFNRTLTFTAAFDIGSKMTPAELAKLGVQDAYEFAVKSVTETQGLYNKGNRPNWARGTVGALVFTFKQYSIAYMEFLKRLWGDKLLPKPAAVTALSVLVLAAGLNGLPGADDLDDLIDTVGNWLGYATNSKRWKREVLSDMAGDAAANFMLHGMSTLPFFPIDVQQRMGLANLVPGTGLLNPTRKDKAREVAEVAGVAGSTAMAMGDFAGALAGGDVRRAALAMLPTAMRNLVQASEMAATGEYRDSRGRLVREVGAGDVAAKAIGFQPPAIADQYRRMRDVQGDIDILTAKQAEFNGRYARASMDGDQRSMIELRQDIADWNVQNPELPVRLNLATIRSKIAEMRLTKEERFAKAAPKSIRERVRDAVSE